MKKIIGLLGGAVCWFNAITVHCAEKFDILPDLPEPLAAAQASSISTTNYSDSLGLASQSVGQQINFGELIISLFAVILLIYASLIIISRLNKFNVKLMKKQIGEISDSQVSVISTTHLGNNKTLHVVELNGKRMLIGASASSIDLIKDLGDYPQHDFEEGEYSKIEIPNIRIPKIEIPKIEFPNMGFTKTFKKQSHKEKSKDEDDSKSSNSTIKEDEDGFVISEIYEENPDGIIDKLFTSQADEKKEIAEEKVEQDNSHMINPDEYALYKKYL